ncbi:MAG: hypothetical protein KDK24_09860 [Pseudooceanicola sp.]|nr:hypothetical protein [Pseudooceanicola sp.]
MQITSDAHLGLILCDHGTHPSVEDLAEFFASRLELLLREGHWRLLVDSRRIEVSPLMASRARAFVMSVERTIQATDAGGDRVFRTVFIAKPGTLGQGAARMIVGNAWGVPRQTFGLAENPDEAGCLLGLPMEWYRPFGPPWTE